MNRSEATKIADAYISKMQAELPYAVAINHALTEEHPVGFVFFYNSKKFWETRAVTDTLVGNGPLLVVRQTGELVVLPSYQSVERSLMDCENLK